MYHCTLCPVGCKPTLNPLSPNIHIQILQTSLYTFPFRISWENLIKDQGILFLVIILLTLITFSLANLWISLGENWCWSLLGLKGIINLFQYVWESLRNYFFNSIFNLKKNGSTSIFHLNVYLFSRMSKLPRIFTWIGHSETSALFWNDYRIVYTLTYRSQNDVEILRFLLSWKRFIN